MSYMNSPQVLVQVENLTKTYSKTNIKPVVSDISWSVHSGEILSLLGPNGAGKTTIVKMIAGLVLPTSGSATVMGYDVVSERQKAVGHIGAVLEGARNLYWRLTAVENLRYFGNLRLASIKELNSRIEELLSLFDLIDHRDKEVGQFSRGMQQKLAVAAALLHEPDVLLLDEPTLGLDVKSARQLEQAILELVKKKGKAVILTTHMMDLAEKIADTVCVIHQGNRVAYGPTADLLHLGDQKNATEIQVVGEFPQVLAETIKHAFIGISIQYDSEFSLITLPSVQQMELMTLLNLLDKHSVTIVRMGQRRATLEEVFLLLTDIGANDIAITKS